MGSSASDPGRWRRRCWSVGGLFLATTLALPTVPLWLGLAAVLDGITGRTYTRAAAFFGWYMLFSVLGVCAATGLWMVGSVWPVPPHREASWHQWLQRWWSERLFWGLSALFELSLEVEGGLSLGSGPILLLCRHVSTADTLLPMVAVANPLGWSVRYVLKRELLWDPCLDIVGQRVPNAFVQRGGLDLEANLQRVHSLTVDLHEREVIVLFPEGTRFTEARRQRVLDRLAELGDEERLQHARGLSHVLPIRVGGVLTLLEGAPSIDVVFLAHAGLEGVTRMSTLVDGSLLRRKLRVHLRRIPGSEVPGDSTRRERWLREQWVMVDRWVGAHAGPD